MSLDEAIRTLRGESGHHLDETVIESLLKSLREGKITMPKAITVPTSYPFRPQAVITGV